MENENIISLKDIKSQKTVITSDKIAEAEKILQKYKDGKANLENRIIENDLWYRMRYTEYIDDKKESANRSPKDKKKKDTAWLFNSLANKHADAMDNYPEAIVRPREESDKAAAETLSQVLPVIIERSGFEKVYSDSWWKKLKSGTAVYGVFWNPRLVNGLGDIEIKSIDLLSLFWEPGITDIQDSANVFYVKLQDTATLENQYPEYKGRFGQSAFNTAKYIHDDNIDTSEKSIVVDWYYKRLQENKTIVHYCKFCNGVLLYSSENDPVYAMRGFYDHGKYPFVFDPLYLEENSPCGFSHVDIMKGSQEQIDDLDDVILDNARRAARTRYFINNSGAVNEAEFANWDSDFIHVQGSNLGEDSIRPISTPTLGGVYFNILNRKVEELKETSGNRDFSQGATTSGVTAASAIAALQEAGGKLTRDMIKRSYFAFKETNVLVIELIRQFYDEERAFRITGADGTDTFIRFNNKSIKMQKTPIEGTSDFATRLPIFDLSIHAAKNTAYSKLSQNELAIQLYQLGFFNPENADVSSAAVEMMDFNDKNKVINTIKNNGTMFQKLQTIIPIALKMATLIEQEKGTNGQLIQELAAVIGNMPGQITPTKVNPNEDNSLEAQSRKRTNEAASPK